MRKMKRKATDLERKYFKIKFPIKDLYIEYIKEPNNSIIKRQAILQMGKRFE